MNAILRWFETAKWWHFWNPGSGLPGGTIGGVIITAAILIWERS